MQRIKKYEISFTALLFVAIVFLASLTHNAKAQERVDLELVLAVDVSSSIDENERAFQRQGYADAFRSEEVIKAILSGPYAAIMVTYFEWSGTKFQHIVTPWTLIDSKEAALQFADDLSQIVPRGHDTTSISSAMLTARDLFNASNVVSFRRVLDISGDGTNNQGLQVDLTRDKLIDEGIVINGLPLLMKPHEQLGRGLKFLDKYYSDCVIGGFGSFLVKAESWNGFPKAIKKKLILEIADLQPEPSAFPVIKAQSQPKTDCRNR